MINIFNIINDILYKKTGSLLKDPDAENQYVPYMVNRWISMHSAESTLYVNLVNRYWSVYETKHQWYKMLCVLIPKLKFKKINYIKKEKEKQKYDANKSAFIETLAKNNDFSKKEIEKIISDNNIDVSKYIKGIN